MPSLPISVQSNTLQGNEYLVYEHARLNAAPSRRGTQKLMSSEERMAQRWSTYCPRAALPSRRLSRG
ncbi:hypothetical protein F01_550063 [Burkholderia cenocepacia]|nr:hypothetical protein F01_550063 [Burkholderia cenocepacia]